MERSRKMVRDRSSQGIAEKMNNPKKIAILEGGSSPEAEVSRSSASQVFEALDILGYQAETFEIALKKAFKRAIEKVNGVSLESNSVLETVDKTITTDGESSATLSRDLQETIKEKTKGSIKTFVITNEFKDSNGIYNVEINATIAKFALSKSAKRKRMAIVPFRINVNEISIFGETYNDAENFRKYLNQEFTNYFVQTRKFTILDREFDKEISEELMNLENSQNLN